MALVFCLANLSIDKDVDLGKDLEKGFLDVRPIYLVNLGVIVNGLVHTR